MITLQGIIRKLLSEKLRSITATLQFTSDKQWCRIVMNRETRKLITALDLPRFDALEISGTQWYSLPFRSYKSVSYPEFDICEQSLPARYDIVFAEQVFEHLLWPYKAGRNVYEMLRSDGYLLTTTPFLIRIHNDPFDCTRWTETGLKYFLAECGFPLEKIHTNSWGNRKCIISNFKGWTRYIRTLHSLRNEPNFPMVVWALAQK